MDVRLGPDSAPGTHQVEIRVLTQEEALSFPTGADAPVAPAGEVPLASLVGAFLEGYCPSMWSDRSEIVYVVQHDRSETRVSVYRRPSVKPERDRLPWNKPNLFLEHDASVGVDAVMDVLRMYDKTLRHLRSESLKGVFLVVHGERIAALRWRGSPLRNREGFEQALAALRREAGGGKKAGEWMLQAVDRLLTRLGQWGQGNPTLWFTHLDWPVPQRLHPHWTRIPFLLFTPKPPKGEALETFTLLAKRSAGVLAFWGEGHKPIHVILGQRVPEDARATLKTELRLHGMKVLERLPRNEEAS